ncbi:Protein T07H6.4 [Aphelenchoides avenae]|nr:Protein T07H6.4 [Aphelenchus avenae]
MGCSVTSYKSGGIAQFTCPPGFSLSGRELHCDANGQWSGSMPVCKATTCPMPLPLPTNGYVIDQGLVNATAEYREGDLVIFGCLPGYMLTGSDFVSCQRDGRWSRLRTKCEPFCRFPGKPEHGDTTTAPKDYYSPGQRVVYYCTEHSYKLNSENVLECMTGGKWSRPIPQCILIDSN